MNTQTLYRCPADLASGVRTAFDACTRGGHVFQASKSSVAFAWRLVRQEHFSASELQEIQALIISQGVDSTTGRILGGSATLSWIDSVLN